LIVRRRSNTHKRRHALIVFGLLAAVFVPALGADIGAALELLVLAGITALVAGYVGLAWRNTTRITCGAGLLEIKHGPLPWPGNLSVDSGAVLQLYCQSKEVRDSSMDTYRVMAIVRDRKRPTVLVDDLDLASHALFLEQAIERALGIEDRPVDGELTMTKLPGPVG